MGDELFEGPTTIGQLLDEQRGKTLSDIAALPSDLLRIHDPDDLEADLLERWRVNPLLLDWDASTSEPSEIEIQDGTHDDHLPGTMVTLFVPFSGPAGLLHIRPSTHVEIPPHGAVRGGETLLLNYSYIDADPATVKRELDQRVAAVKECVSSINSDVGAYNAELPKLIHEAVKARLHQVIAAEEVVGALGVPLHQRPPVKRVEIEPDRERTRRASGQAQPHAPPEERRPHRRRRTGRPTGSGWLIMDRTELLDAYRQARQHAGGRRPTQRELAKFTHVGVTTLKRSLQRFGLAWPPE